MLAEVFEVFADEGDELLRLGAVGVEEGVGVGEAHEGEVGAVGGLAGCLELAHDLRRALVVALGEELAHAVVGGLEAVGDDFEAEAAQLGAVLEEVLQHVVDEAALLHIVLRGLDFVVLDDAQEGFGVLGGLGDGELGVGLDGVAQRGVELVALLVGGLQGVGELAVAVALEGLVLGLEGGVELVLALAPELVVDGQLGGALAEGGHILVMGRVGRPRDGDLVDLHCYFHNLEVLLMILSYAIFNFNSQKILCQPGTNRAT